MSDRAVEVAARGTLASARAGIAPPDLVDRLVRAGAERGAARRAVDRLVETGGAELDGSLLHLSPEGYIRLLEDREHLVDALDPAPAADHEEECPSLPWLTTVRTRWIDALSINWAVDPDALARLLPDPIEPEIHAGSAWVQLLVSSLRDMRPQGLDPIFGMNFYQASYRAAVRYPREDGSWKRGGYFVRCDTNDRAMRAVGLALNEFRFHEFFLSEMVLVRKADRLHVGIDPDPDTAGGDLVGVFDTRPCREPPDGSVWSSLEELSRPLVECYDAFGVDRDEGCIYILTIDRDPWDPVFVEPLALRAEFFETGPLGGEASRYDSTLHVKECAYRWRPLRREPIPGG